MTRPLFYRLETLLVALATILFLFAPASAQVSDDVVKIGVLDDMSGPFADLQGMGDVAAARLAIQDFGGKVLGKPIELTSGDCLNKLDVGMSIARRWYDTEKVDAIFGLCNSAVALAVQDMSREKNRINIATSAVTADLTGKKCSPNAAHWGFDTYSVPRATALATLKNGGDSWFFITVDYAFGHSLEQNTRSVVEANGGKVLGAVRAPLNTSDFSSYILQAQGSGAKIIGLANTGADVINSVKQLQEFGIGRGNQKVAGLLVNLTDVRSMGLKSAEGLMFSDTYYWDQNDETRAFAARFAMVHGRPPTAIQASTYSAVAHYLKAIEAAGTDNAPEVMAKMKSLPVNDFMTKNGILREDGRLIRNMYVMTVKAEAESKGEWDLLKVVSTIKGEDAFRSLKDGGCPFIKAN